MKILCLTPVRNEAWILKRFLQCASLWADHILIADQDSTDGSREIAASFGKVTLVSNPSQKFNEPERQALLISEARRLVPGKKLLLALDADEFLSANFAHSAAWRALQHQSAGTVIRFLRANITPAQSQYWIPPYTNPWGFVDDGSPHRGQLIHSPRLPLPQSAPSILIEDVKVLHYQFTDMNRMRSKHRWYQCLERTLRAHRSPITVFRQYHYADGFHTERRASLPAEWLEAYEQEGIDMRTCQQSEAYWWDKESLRMMENLSPAAFSDYAIWDVDWVALARSYGLEAPERFRDPRTARQRRLQRWLGATQQAAHLPHVRTADLLLRSALAVQRWSPGSRPRRAAKG